MSKKKQVLKLANIGWNGFKTRLTSLYVFKKHLKKRKLPTEDDPFTAYPFIKVETWQNFKNRRLTDEFKAVSEIAAERQKKNLYPHRMSRGGYQKARQKAVAKLRASNELIDDTSTPTIDRGDLWIEARLGKDGECLNSETKEAVGRINSLKEEASRGGFTPNGKDDVLTKALGTNERYGRVRGVGGVVGHKQYFGKCPRSRGEGVSNIDLEMLTQIITEKVRADMKKEMSQLIVNKTTESSSNIDSTEKGIFIEKEPEVAMNIKDVNNNCYRDEHDPFASIPDEDDACEMTMPKRRTVDSYREELDLFASIPDQGVACELSVPEKGKVALGKVFRAPNDDSRSHGIAFGKNELRVSIEIVYEGFQDTQLPLPTEEFFTVGDAHGSFVRWPKNLVTITCPQKNVKAKVDEKAEKLKTIRHAKSNNVDSATSKRKEPAKSCTSLTKILENKFGCQKVLSKMVAMMDSKLSSSFVLNDKVVGYEQKIFLTKNDIAQLLEMKRLNISIIQAFVGCLHGICNTKIYGFVCPQIASLVGQNYDKATTYVSNWMNKERKSLYMVPYINNGHWMLAVVDIVKNNYVHWFDPLGQPERSNFKHFLNMCIAVYRYNGGTRKSTTPPKWVQVNCARQPGGTECGYYVMRYMLELVARTNSDQPIDEIFHDTRAYSQQDIDEVRDLWADYFLSI